ncbi:proteinase [Virgisporangium aliadipatigenens]|uniref:Proteinase n=1 Tax=Virgisporangium aliadipatigenens TaxID=741659 RepID=A0A8J4DUX3_9ACTN|nr:alpha/beta hydrolase [Virgisporangium aliadipatigenens]GIJ50861.1 proteinase [Virgisporangium aliadipatigenens]
MIRRPRAAVALVTAALLLLTGCVSPPTRWAGPISGRPGASASGSTAPGQVNWTPCPEISERKLPNITFECTTLKVPQDWAAPNDGKTFDLSLVRARAKGQNNKIGSLLINPGGPGGSGVEMATYLAAALPTDVLFRFDIVGFDPRGVGRSSPVECFTDADLDANFGADPDPQSQADFDALVGLTGRMARSCGDKYGDTLRLFSTEQAARDMDAIRIAVGDEKLSYLGYSYGTLLGATYAQLFPKNIRALVLDGAVDPTQSSVASSEGQAKGFERAFDNFTTWCKSNGTRCPISSDPRGLVTQAINNARGNAVAGAGGRKATAGWVFTAVIASLYTEQSWESMAKAMDNLRKGNPAGIFELADSYAERDASGKYSNLFDANLAVNCADDDKSVTVEEARRLQGEWRQKYPLFGASLALNLVCAQWPGKRDPYPKGKAEGAPPIVVVGTKGDPATPYEQTPALANMLGTGVVLTWEGEGHTAYPQTRCINQAVNSYLIDLKVPAAGASCPAR